MRLLPQLLHYFCSDKHYFTFANKVIYPLCNTNNNSFCKLVIFSFDCKVLCTKLALCLYACDDCIDFLSWPFKANGADWDSSRVEKQNIPYRKTSTTDLERLFPLPEKLQPSSPSTTRKQTAISGGDLLVMESMPVTAQRAGPFDLRRLKEIVHDDAPQEWNNAVITRNITILAARSR